MLGLKLFLGGGGGKTQFTQCVSGVFCMEAIVPTVYHGCTRHEGSNVMEVTMVLIKKNWLSL